MMETRLIPKKFLKLIKNLADENRNYKKIFGNVFWLEVVKEKNYTWFNLRLNSTFSFFDIVLFLYLCPPVLLSGAGWICFSINPHFRNNFKQTSVLVVDCFNCFSYDGLLFNHWYIWYIINNIVLIIDWLNVVNMIIIVTFIIYDY